MIVTVRYRIDAHAYRKQLGGCAPGCAACALEAGRFRSEDEAFAAQPSAERALPGGSPDALVPSPRRFEVVVVDHFA